MGKLQRRAGTWNTWEFHLHDRTRLRINPMHVHGTVQFVTHGILNHMGFLNKRLVAWKKLRAWQATEYMDLFITWSYTLKNRPHARC